jgi:hypothetical protein
MTDIGVYPSGMLGIATRACGVSMGSGGRSILVLFLGRVHVCSACHQYRNAQSDSLEIFVRIIHLHKPFPLILFLPLDDLNRATRIHYYLFCRFSRPVSASTRGMGLYSLSSDDAIPTDARMKAQQWPTNLN